MTDLECVLAIDLGTSGPKVALVATSGAVVESDYEPTQLILTDDGGVEQDPDDWWRAITTATRRMMDRTTVGADRIIGVCCTAQWLGTVAVDGAGRHLMNALIWMDARGAPYMPDIPMHPRPSAETRGPSAPSCRVIIIVSVVEGGPTMMCVPRPDRKHRSSVE